MAECHLATELEGDCVIGLGRLDQDCELGVENDMGEVDMFSNCMYLP